MKGEGGIIDVSPGISGQAYLPQGGPPLLFAAAFLVVVGRWYAMLYMYTCTYVHTYIDHGMKNRRLRGCCDHGWNEPLHLCSFLSNLN